MRQGRFTTALEQYDAAEQVAPNNSLVLLGRAHAELGGAFYTRADQNLRDALRRDPTLLMGIYDLKAMIGEERLTQVVNDLRKIAAADADESRALFLLAYIAYNSDNARLARQWLEEAERREGADRDRIYQTLRTYWHLPESEPGGQRTPEPQEDVNK
jgi:cytochrome c-type biogenesis protein CcmH/NrfG